MKKLYCAGIVFLGSQAVFANEDMHLVKRGDTLFNIGKKYYKEDLGVSFNSFYNEMLIYNSFIKNPNKIYPGQSIIVPKFEKLTYEVKNGDTFNQIVKDHASFSSVASFQDKISKIRDLNPQIKNFDLIIPGELINVGYQIRSSDSSEFAYYRVKKDEYVLKVISDLYGKSNQLKHLGVIKKLNPQIPDINLVFTDQIIRIPARKDIQNVVLGYSDRVLASVESKAQLHLNSLKLRKEIFNLSSVEANVYVKLFKKFQNYSDQTDWIEALEEIQSIAISNNHQLIERALSHLSDNFRDQKELRYLRADLSSFLKTWRSSRIKKRNQI